ncbi:efflux RND transporter periplasmic adaptor subunit [Aliifodinibius salicampi]|uniref:Efflux RND transporter periplasmic adaptor subunit n=1 Tax=Fodinibius salicampi TaxID=1920655 RepID=A0ABT3Q0C0_9BACT|nr:efflux RND transporter periplasmic adaptor subunit [Fodinibius salicampi]MCW9713532.1 efflux RND transporter periplasmic adaptor subunit [Fodinibius salicampi]
MDWKKTLLICFIILIAGLALTTLIFSTEPTATQTGATQETAMLVDVTSVQQGNFRPTIKAMGTVEAAQDIMLSPRVNGEVIERSPSFTPGGYVEKGEVLLQIDSTDYRNTLQQRKSELRQAQSDLNLEMGRQEAAQSEYRIFGDTLTEENEARILRQPQLNAVKASVESAQAAVDQAEAELQRTTIRAPFDAHILSRNVNVGSQVAAGEQLGRLVGLDEYWVEATVPVSELRWLNFAETSESEGSEVKIRNRTAWEEGEFREGHLDKMMGALAEQTRLARVLISVPDPLAYHTENADLPKLMIGSFVEATLQGEELTNVIRLNRDFIRTDDTVWIMEDQQLHIKNVDIVFRDEQYAYIANGLNKQDQVVTTNLTTVAEGAPLRLEATDSTSSE